MPAAIDWTPELESGVLEGIQSGLTLRQVAEKHNISDSLILKKAREDEEFCKQYARVIELRTDRDFESLDDDLEEQPQTVSTKFGEMIDPAWVQLKRLKIDTKKWALSKRCPKKYGDKITHAGDSDQPLEMIVRRIGPK